MDKEKAKPVPLQEKLKQEIKELRRDIEMNADHISGDYIKGCLDVILKVEKTIGKGSKFS